MTFWIKQIKMFQLEQVTNSLNGRKTNYPK